MHLFSFLFHLPLLHHSFLLYFENNDQLCDCVHQNLALIHDLNDMPATTLPFSINRYILYKHFFYLLSSAIWKTTQFCFKTIYQICISCIIKSRQCPIQLAMNSCVTTLYKLKFLFLQIFNLWNVF